MYVCVHIYDCRSREGIGSFGVGVTLQVILKHSKRVLGTELMSSGRAVNALSCRVAASLALLLRF